MVYTQKELSLFKKLYPKVGPQPLAKLLNRSVHSIIVKAHRLGIRSGTPAQKPAAKLNENVFENRTLEAYYWAGFIAADGCIYHYSKKKRSQKVLIIKLNKKDKIILERFVKFLKYEGNIYEVPQENAVKINIVSDKICNDLKFFNIGPRKSETLRPPKNLTYKQSLIFIKGYIDGDGYIGRDSRDFQLRVGIIGTKPFLNWIKKIFSETIDTSTIKLHKHHNKDNAMYNFVVQGNKKALKVLQIVNKSISIGLERKWRKLNQ